MRYKVLRTLKSTEVKPALLVTPVLECIEGGYRTHHINVMEGYRTRKFVPIRHVSNKRRIILDLEEENAKLRELMVELWALAYGYAPYESELDAARDMMRELGIEVD